VVAEEPLVDGNPSLTGYAATLTNDILELDSERTEEPGEDDVVHPLQVGRAEAATSEVTWSSRAYRCSVSRTRSRQRA
jgi:hypothetical protein